MKKILATLFITIAVVGCVMMAEVDQFYVLPNNIEEIPADPMNQMTMPKYYLGQYAFNSPILSDDGRTACTNCHSQEHGWTTPDVQFAGGCGQGCLLVGERLVVDTYYHGDVDSMNIKSIGPNGIAYSEGLGGWSGRFGRDGANKEIHDIQTKHFGGTGGNLPVCEVGVHQAFIAQFGHRQLLKKRVLNDSIAIRLIEAANPNVDSLHNITEDSLALLIACGIDVFERIEGLKEPSETKFQRVMEGRDQFTNREELGYRVFKRNCQSCHNNPMMGGGLNKGHQPALDHVFPDHRGEVTGLEKDSLIRLTRPIRGTANMRIYGVDGSFKSKREYLEYINKDFDMTDNELGWLENFWNIL